MRSGTPRSIRRDPLLAVEVTVQFEQQTDDRCAAGFAGADHERVRAGAEGARDIDAHGALTTRKFTCGTAVQIDGHLAIARAE